MVAGGTFINTLLAIFAWTAIACVIAAILYGASWLLAALTYDTPHGVYGDVVELPGEAKAADGGNFRRGEGGINAVRAQRNNGPDRTHDAGAE